MIDSNTPNEELLYDSSLDPISPSFDIRSWGHSIQSAAQSTSYEDYLRRMTNCPADCTCRGTD
jgi:hypothetical protein